MTFGSKPTWRVTLGPVRERATPIVADLQAMRFDERWTDLMSPLLSVAEALVPAKDAGAILLVSDGVISLASGRAAENKDASIVRELVASTLAGRGVRVFGLAIPSTGDELVLDLARRTGGVGRRLNLDEDLDHLASELATRLCEPRPSPAQPLGPSPDEVVPPSSSTAGTQNPPSTRGTPGAWETQGPQGSPNLAGTPPPPTSSSPPPPLGSGLDVVELGPRWSFVGGLVMVLLAGLSGGALAWFLWRRRPLLSRLIAPPIAPGSFDLPELEVASPPGPRLIDDAASTPTSLSFVLTCAAHPGKPTIWHCTSCGRAGCASCPKSSHEPPRCQQCTRAPVAPEWVASDHLVFIVVWNEARAKVLKKCEMWRENESVAVFGRGSALAPLDDPPSMGGRLRLTVDPDGRQVVVIDETPPGGFYCVEDGQVLRPGDRLRNNQRFQWHRDNRVFEVIYK